MVPHITKDLAQALDESGTGQLEVVNPNNNRRYLLVDREVYEEAMVALQNQRDRDAIAKGIEQMEAGEGSPLDETFARIQGRLQTRQPE